MRRELVGWAIFVAVCAALPWLGISADRYLMFLANVMLMFMILALSWDVVARTGQLSLAHGAFFGLGAYTVAIAYRSAHIPWATISASGSSPSSSAFDELITTVAAAPSDSCEALPAVM